MKVKSQYNYIVYNPAESGWTEHFKTYQEALNYISNIDISEGVPEEYINGDLFIAKIVSRSKFKVTDKQSNYPCLKHNRVAECGSYNDCTSECEGTEEWPYSMGIDEVGVIEMVNIEEDSNE